MLCWNVYVGGFNSGEIRLFNVFNHYRFYQDCLKAKKKFREDKEGFANEVRKSLMYHYWSKCEWEIILDHWPNGEFYEMRKKLTAGELKNALRNSGIEYDVSASYRMPDDRKIEIRVFPQECRFRDKKIDVYDQIENNWDIFIDYLWNNRKELKARKD